MRQRSRHKMLCPPVNKLWTSVDKCDSPPAKPANFTGLRGKRFFPPLVEKAREAPGGA